MNHVAFRNTQNLPLAQICLETKNKGTRNRLKNRAIHKKEGKRTSPKTLEEIWENNGAPLRVTGALDAAAAAATAEETLQYEEKCLSVKVRCEC